MDSEIKGRLEAGSRQQRATFVDLAEWRGISPAEAKINLDALDVNERAQAITEIDKARQAAERRFRMGVADRMARLEEAKVVMVTREKPGRSVYDIYRVNGLKLDLVEAGVLDRQLAGDLAQLVAEGGGMTSLASTGGGVMLFSDEGPMFA